MARLLSRFPHLFAGLREKRLPLPAAFRLHAFPSGFPATCQKGLWITWGYCGYDRLRLPAPTAFHALFVTPETLPAA